MRRNIVLTKKENRILDSRKRFDDPKFDVTITEIKKRIDNVAKGKTTFKVEALKLGFSDIWLRQLVYAIYDKSAMQFKKEVR